MSNTGTFLDLICLCSIEKQNCTELNFVKDGSTSFRNRKDVLAFKHVFHIIFAFFFRKWQSQLPFFTMTHGHILITGILVTNWSSWIWAHCIFGHQYYSLFRWFYYFFKYFCRPCFGMSVFKYLWMVIGTSHVYNCMCSFFLGQWLSAWICKLLLVIFSLSVIFKNNCISSLLFRMYATHCEYWVRLSRLSFSGSVFESGFFFFLQISELLLCSHLDFQCFSRCSKSLWWNGHKSMFKNKTKLQQLLAIFILIQLICSDFMK